MCIIMYSKAGVGYPDRETLEYCWDSNPDGAGYAFLTTDDKWAVKKGLMDKDEFFAAWDAEEFQTGHTVILHFRIGTSGSMDGACTHPFPIHDEYDELTKLEYESEDIVFHNGIHGKGEDIWSDTMLAIRDYIVPIYPLIEDEKIKNIMNILLKSEHTYGSRWCFGRGENVLLMGKWHEDETTGIMYSKDDWKKTVYEASSWHHFHRDVHPSFRGGSYNKRAENCRALTVVNQQRTRHTDITHETGIYASVFEGKDGNWSWAEWATYKDDVWDEEGTSTKSDANDVIEIFDTNNNVVALLDHNGETIWDESAGGHEATTTPQTIKECPKCNADLFEGDFDDDGDCPWCGTPIFTKEGATLYQCPSCQEENYLIDSTFDSGDSECLRCGALFLDTITGIESIVGWNMDTATNHSQMIKTMMKEGNE